MDDNGDDKNLKNYFISDHGSSTGTFLNGIRLSESQQCSEKHAIVHGSIVKVSICISTCYFESKTVACPYK